MGEVATLLDFVRFLKVVGNSRWLNGWIFLILVDMLRICTLHFLEQA